MKGNPIEQGFDESKISALESKLSQYLTMTQISNQQIEEEKLQIHSLISNISHQTRTPISNILLYSQLLDEEDLTKECKKYTKELVNQAEKLDFLVDSLVKLSRLEHGIISVHPEENDIHTLLYESTEQVYEKAEAKNIKITYDMYELTAVFDLKWTIEAVCNILDNAIKYSLENSQINIMVTKLEMFCRIDIQDYGMGIKEEEICHIFTRFYRGIDVQEKEGVGIGLYLSREILLAQGGYIKASSTPSKGTCFSLYLPVK